MAPQNPVATSDGVEEADLAKAFQELAKGERTATALENQLNAMEAKLEALLQAAEREQQEVQNGQSDKDHQSTSDRPSNDDSTQPGNKT